MKSKIIFVVVLFAISSSLFSQRRTQIVDVPLETQDGIFSLYNSKDHCVMHTVTSVKNNVTNHGIMILNFMDFSAKIVALKGIDEANPFFFSPIFTRNGFGFFEAFENKKENKIDIYFHEVSFRDLTNTSTVIHSVQGGDRKKMLMYFAENIPKQKSVLYIVKIGDEKRNASATIINLDYQRNITHTQEVEFTGSIDAKFNSYVTLSEKGSLVCFHQVKNDKGVVKSEISVINTNRRESNVAQTFMVTSDDDEILTSHKIYVDDQDFIHFYGTVKKKKNLTKSLLQYKIFGVARDNSVLSQENEINLNDNIHAHSLLTLSAEYTFYIVEEGNIDNKNGGMTILGGTKPSNKYTYNPNDDPETKLRKQEEIRILKEQGHFDNNNLTGAAEISKNSIHIFCLDKNKEVIWTDVIRRNASYTASDLAEMDDAQFGIYFWAFEDKLMCIYNRDHVASVTSPNISSNSNPSKKTQTTSIREYFIKSGRFIEKDFEPAEKSVFKYVILPNFAKINATQSLIILVKTEKGVYHPMKMMF